MTVVKIFCMFLFSFKNKKTALVTFASNFVISKYILTKLCNISIFNIKSCTE